MATHLHFDRFELRPTGRLLLADSQPLPLGARAFDVLLALVLRRERVVTKAELMDLVWPGLVVEENNLSVQISALRRLLGARVIATVAGRGYQFVATVSEVPAHSGPAGATASSALGRGCILAFKSRHPGLAGEAGAAAEALLRSHGAWAQPAGGTGVQVAVMPSARAAVACAHALRHGAGLAAAELGMALYRDLSLADAERRAVDAAVDIALRLLSRCPAGETWASAGVVQELVISLDGDAEDLGSHHGLCAETTTRVFRLTAPPAGVAPATGAPRQAKLRPTLAVIPFGSYAREAGPLGWGDILTDQLIGQLSHSSSLHVISRLSTLAFRGRNNAVAEIARCLAADFVVSGSYLLNAGQVQVHVELADAINERVLWSGSFVDSELAALQLDSALVQALVGGISQAIFVSEVQRLRGHALPDLASHTLLLSGISLMYRLAPSDFALARQALLTVSERSPGHAMPLAWLARWHLFRVVQGWSDDRDADGRAAQSLAQRALDLDPDSALALTMLGNVATSYLKDLDRAQSLYEQALSLNPNESLAWLQKGNAHSFRGEGAQALEHAQRASRLSPLDPSRHYYLSILASAQLTARDYEGAAASARQSLRMNHEHVSTHRVLAIALAMSGRHEEARASVRQVLRLEPRLTVAEYVSRSPGAQSGLARTFGDALHAAGLPLGPAATSPTEGEPK